MRCFLLPDSDRVVAVASASGQRDGFTPLSSHHNLLQRRCWSTTILMLTDLAMQGHGDGYHHDRAPERRQNVLAEGTGGEPLRAISFPTFQTDCVVQGGEFTIEYVRPSRI